MLVNLALVGKKIALMFGIRGMYLRNNILVKTDTTMSYEELAKAKQIRAMDKYNLAIDSRQFACSGLTADVKLDDLVRAVVQLRARLQ